MMKRLTMWILCISFVVCGTGFSAMAWDFGVKGSGMMKTETRAIDDFTGLILECSGDVTIMTGDETSCTVSADDNLIPLILTEIEGENLRITTKESISTSNPITVNIVTPHLKSATLKGSGKIIVRDIREQSLDLAISGSGDIESDGSVDTLTVSVTGSGDIKAYKTPAKNVHARISGSGDIEVTATEAITAEVLGSGDIRYKGNPSKKKTSVTGSGEILNR